MESRSTPANRRYWQIVTKVAEAYAPDGRRFSADVWHEQFKRHWIGADEVKLPNGETLVLPHSTADLTVEEFSEFMTAVESWANSRDVYLDE